MNALATTYNVHVHVYSIPPYRPSCGTKTDYVGPIEDSLDMLDSNEVRFKRDGSIQPPFDPNSNSNSPRNKRNTNNKIQ